MPTYNYPKDNTNWNVSYIGEFFGDIVKSFNLSFTTKQGKISVSRRTQPNTITNSTNVPRDYVLTNADQTLRYWKSWSFAGYYKTPGTSPSGAFTVDTLTNTPSGSGTEDADLEVFGRTSGGFDILYGSNGVNVARLNMDVSTTAWTPNYWTGLKATIQSSTNATPIVITTAANHGYSTNDRVTIRNHQVNTNANGNWVIIVVSPTTFSLTASAGNGVGGATGTANRTFQASNGLTFLGQPDFDSAYPVVLKRFSSNSQDLLFLGNNNLIASVDLQGNVVYPRLTFFQNYKLAWIQCTKDRVYIGFKDPNGDQLPSYIVEYDPLNEISRAVPIQSGSTIGFIWDNICYLVDVKGHIGRFNANGFTTIAAFPPVFIDGNTFTFVPHRNSVAFIENRPHFLINTGSFNAGALPGVWCLEPETNRLTHRFSFASSNSAQSDFGAASNNTGNNFGALFALTGGQNFFAGASVYITQGGNLASGTFSNAVVSGGTSFNNRGWFITSKFPARRLNAMFHNLSVRYNPRQYPYGQQGGAIVVKYRIKDTDNDASSAITGTWVTSTTFTVAAASVTNLAVGDEIFIFTGNGCGATAHVTVITGASTKTVTIDEAVGGTLNFFFMYENWRKLGSTTDNVAQSTPTIDIPEGEAEWLELKVELRAAGSSPFLGFNVEQIQVGYQENLRLDDEQYQTV